jgi:hypothetical protein
MLQKGKVTPQIQEWYDKLAPVVQEAQRTLKNVKPEKLMLRSGCQQDKDGNFRLDFFWQTYIVGREDFAVRWAESGDETPSFIASLILTYLVTADGTTLSSRWIGFRELPGGMFYVRAFEGYSGGRLVRELQGGVEAFRRGAQVLGGQPLDMGDAAYVFDVLPRIRVALAYWEGDEEFPAQFPSQARVLFEDTAARYLPTDGLAILGSQLVGKLLKASR